MWRLSGKNHPVKNLLWQILLTKGMHSFGCKYKNSLDKIFSLFWRKKIITNWTGLKLKIVLRNFLREKMLVICTDNNSSRDGLEINNCSRMQYPLICKNIYPCLGGLPGSPKFPRDHYIIGDIKSLLDLKNLGHFMSHPNSSIGLV